VGGHLFHAAICSSCCEAVGQRVLGTGMYN